MITDQNGGKAKLRATTARQAEQGLQLSTAEGVVITKVSRVFKLREDGDDYVFSEDGSILPSTNLASARMIAINCKSPPTRLEMGTEARRWAGTPPK